MLTKIISNTCNKTTTNYYS